MRNSSGIGLIAVAAAVVMAAAAAGAAASAAVAPGPGAMARGAAASTPVATFSIVARDAVSGDLGIAVESRFLAVGAVVPWARAGVGAVATQSYANTTYGPLALEAMAGGASAQQALDALVAGDAGAAQRQVGIVDASGAAATYTGDACLPWAGGRTGDGYAVQGNILAGPEVVDAMATAFEASSGDLASRLVQALVAGQAAGGDARGRQSAALLVVREDAGYGGFNDRYIDLRVDDHPQPIVELRRLLALRMAQAAASESGAALRRGEIPLALEAAQRAVDGAPGEGGNWLLLAAAHLAAGDPTAADAAATEGLVRDPWIKQAALRGLIPAAQLQALLQLPGFAALWETLPAR